MKAIIPQIKPLCVIVMMDWEKLYAPLSKYEAFKERFQKGLVLSVVDMDGDEQSINCSRVERLRPAKPSENFIFNVFPTLTKPVRDMIDATLERENDKGNKSPSAEQLATWTIRAIEVIEENREQEEQETENLKQSNKIQVFRKEHGRMPTADELKNIYPRENV